MPKTPRDLKHRIQLDILRAMETQRVRIEQLATEIGELMTISGATPLQILCAVTCSLHSFTEQFGRGRVADGSALRAALCEAILTDKEPPPQVPKEPV